MKSYLVMTVRRAAVFGSMAVIAGLMAGHARASQWDKKTILTVENQPIQIRETVLEPGQYVLKLLDTQADRHVVQIFNRDQTHIINTILAIPATRMEPAGDTQFTFWETPPGTAKAMRTWFYPGDSFGQEFPYPKHLQTIAMAMPAPAPEAAPAPAPAPAPETEAAPAPEAPPEPAPAAAPEPQAPAQSEPEQPATPPPAEQPQELPKTSSPYPLFGLSGALLLGLYGLLRWKRAM